MKNVAVVGAGITGVTTAYALLCRGYEVTVYDTHRYPAMETSYANGGQLSACNAEVWNNWSTIAKGMKWLLRKDAPLLFNFSPTWHKYSWIAEFLLATRHYRQNTEQTVHLALMARKRLFEIAEIEGIEFNLSKRGILHFYKSKGDLLAAARTNQMLNNAGLERHAVTPAEIRRLEPALKGDLVGGYYTEGDATGDIHRFTKELAAICEKRGVVFRFGVDVAHASANSKSVHLKWRNSDVLESVESSHHDAIVVCAGVHSRRLAGQLGDRINVYPVKGYSITVPICDDQNAEAAPQVSLLDEAAKIVASRLGRDRYRVAGTAEINGFNKDIRADRIRPLVEWVQKHHPSLDTSGTTPWAGLRPMMPDMMPRACRGRQTRVFYNTGHGHLGWTLSAATADIIAEQVSQETRKFVRSHRVSLSGTKPLKTASHTE